MSGQLFSSGAIVVMVMLFLYMLLGALLEKYHSPIGHEASLLVLIGFAISLISF